MKQKLAVILIAALLLSTSMTSCSQVQAAVTVETLGEFLPLTAMTSGSERLVDDSGMSGLEASIHLHDSDKENMYFVTGQNKKQELVFDIGQIESLGYLYVWNYNEIGKEDCGMKRVRIYYSLDGEEWTDLGDTYKLAKCDGKETNTYGGNAASNLDNAEHSPIDFGGVPARYIKIEPHSNWWGEGYGLSEIRLFRHKTRPSPGEMITPIAFAPQNLDSNAENAANGTGMSDLGSIDATHSNRPQDMWLSETDAENSMLILNLDGTYPVEKIALWNYNDINNLGACIKDVAIYYTVEAPCTINAEKGLNFKSGSWTKLGEYTLEKGSGTAQQAMSLEIPLENIHIQHLKIVPLSNYGGTETGFGLSEIRVFSGSGWAVEPSRDWSGLLSSSGDFDYQNAGEHSADGWLGADGINTVSLNSDQMPGSLNQESKTLFTFQDTVYGNMRNYEKDTFTANLGYKMNHGGITNGSYLVLSGDKPDPRNAQFIINNTTKNADKHPLGNIYPDYYWMADTTVIDDAIYTIANLFQGLGVEKVDLFKTPLNTETGFPDYMEYEPEQMKIEEDFFYQNRLSTLNIHFDTIMEDTEDGQPYIYAYARGKDSKLVVARVKQEDYATFSNVQYWSGNKWSDNPIILFHSNAWISDFAPGNEFNITKMRGGKLDGKYLNVFTGSSLYGQIQFSISDSPTGMFTDIIDLYWTPEQYQYALGPYQGFDYDGQVLFEQWSYNAKGHPAISKEGELLISYNFAAQNIPQANTFGFNSTAIEYSHPKFVCLFSI